MLGSESKENILNRVLAILGETARVDRSYVFENTYENHQLHTMGYAFEWVANGIEPHLHNPQLQDVPWSFFNELRDLLASGQHFVSATRHIANTAFRESLEMQHIKSVLFVPVFADKQFWGFIGFDDCKEERNWDETELLTLASIAANLGAFIERTAMQEQLLQQHKHIDEQKNFYEGLLNNVPADIVVFTADHRYHYVSKNAVKNEELRAWLIGKDDYDYCAYRNKPVSIANERRAMFNEVKETLKPVSKEECYENDGQVKYMLRVMYPVLGSDGKLEYMLGYGVDTTALKQRDELILKQHRAIENSSVGIALLDAEGRYYYMNRAHEQFFEYEPGELLGKTWHSIYTPNEIKKISELHFPILMREGRWHGEAVGRSKYGKVVHQDLTLSLFDDGGLVCITRDVTQMRDELLHVQRTHQQLELALHAAHLGMWTWDVQQGKIQVSEVLREMMSCDEDNGRETTLNKLMTCIHPEDAIAIEPLIETFLKTPVRNEQEVYRKEVRISDKKGGYFWTLAIGKVSATTPQGTPAELTGFVLNIDEQKLFDEKIKQSEKRYRDLVESLNEVIFQTETNGICTFFNRNWTEITGYSVAESVGQPLPHFMHPNDQPLFMQLHERLLAGESLTDTAVLRIVSKSGDLLWFNFKFTLRRNELHRPFAIMGSAENISARKEVEAELEYNRELLHKIVSSVDDVIWSVDTNSGRLSYISSSCLGLTGLPDTVFYERDADFWYELVDPDFVQLLRESDEQIIARAITSRQVVYKLKPQGNGESKWVRDQAKGIYNEEGRLVRVDGVTTDITELMNAELKLKLSEEKYRLISENIQDVITIFNVQGEVSYVSPSAQALTGYPVPRMSRINVLMAVHPDDREEVAEFIRNCSQQKGASSLVCRFIKANGDLIWLETIVKVLHTDDKGMVRLQASSRDITIRRQAELELTRALQKEKELGELKSRFVSMASHEFRTPLSTIRAGAELIRIFMDKDTRVLSEENRRKVYEKLDDILIDVDRIADLMSDILTMGKIEASRVPFNPQPVYLQEFIGDYLGHEAQRVIGSRKVMCALPNEPVTVMLDAKLMKQVLQNALSNAVKYSKASGVVRLTTKVLAHQVELSISDEGIGIPEKDLPFIFQSFFRSTNVENISGTGLGMSIMKLFTEMHGGTITVSSKLGQGTTVTLSLPLA